MYVRMGQKDVWGFTIILAPSEPILSNTMSREVIRLADIKSFDRHLSKIFILIHGRCFNHTKDITVGINPYFINRQLIDVQ